MLAPWCWTSSLQNREKSMLLLLKPQTLLFCYGSQDRWISTSITTQPHFGYSLLCPPLLPLSPDTQQSLPWRLCWYLAVFLIYSGGVTHLSYLPGPCRHLSWQSCLSPSTPMASPYRLWLWEPDTACYPGCIWLALCPPTMCCELVHCQTSVKVAPFPLNGREKVVRGMKATG